MTISSANLVAPDQKLVLTDLKENLPIPATSTKLPGHGKLLTAEHSTASDGAPHGTSRHSAAAEVLQLRAELHRERLASAAAKADSLRLIENMCAQRDEARERALGLQAALDAHLRAEAARLADDARSARSTPTPPAAAARIVAAPHLHTAPGTAGGPPASQDEAALLAAVAQPLGFHRGRPVAAALIFRCCMHWGTLEHDPAALGERIIAAVTRHADSGNMPPAGDAAAHHCYWLANTATLLLLLQQHTQATAVPPPQHLSLLSSARSKLSMLARYRPSGTEVSALSGGGFQAHHGGTRRPAHILKQAMADCVDSLMTDLRDGAKHALQAPLSVRAPTHHLAPGRFQVETCASFRFRADSSVWPGNCPGPHTHLPKHSSATPLPAKLLDPSQRLSMIAVCHGVRAIVQQLTYVPPCSCASKPAASA